VPYLRLRQYLTELLPGRLPHDAFHLQIEKRSENLGRVQAGSLDDVVDVHGFVGTEEFVELFFGGIQRGADEEVSLFGFRLFGFYERGANGRGEFVDDVFCVCDQLRALLDQLVWREADWLRYVPGTPKASLPNSMARRAVVSEPLY
jgi:hypothetical protein